MSKISDEDFIKQFRAFVAAIAPAPERNPTQNPIIGALYEVIDMVETREKTEANPNGQFHNVTPEKPATPIPQLAATPTPTTTTPTAQSSASEVAIVTLGPDVLTTATAAPATVTPAAQQQTPPGYHGVLIDGQVPAEPKSFFRTRKFKAIGVLVAVVVGMLSYFIYGGHI